MAKKFGKFLLFTAAIGGAAAAAYYYFQKKDADNFASEDEDYDDFSEDLDDDAETGKNYVTLIPDSEASEEGSEETKKDTFVPLNQVAQPTDKSQAKTGDKADAEVEEFFDEEDSTDEESLLKDN